MSNSKRLSSTRTSTVINVTSKQQEKDIITVLKIIESKIESKYAVVLDFKKQLLLKDIVLSLRKSFPDVDFYYNFENTYICPDGGILSILDSKKQRFPILISEVKNQGTNDRRLKEGLKKQPKGNAIERLGKNVIGLRTAFITENIFPFVCFGYGCDFADQSSILDRVVTIAMFGKLNVTHLHRQGPNGEFDRGSFYFREAKWSIQEMAEIMYDIAEQSIRYYFLKYGENRFLLTD